MLAYNCNKKSLPSALIIYYSLGGARILHVQSYPPWSEVLLLETDFRKGNHGELTPSKRPSGPTATLERLFLIIGQTGKVFSHNKDTIGIRTRDGNIAN